MGWRIRARTRVVTLPILWGKRKVRTGEIVAMTQHLTRHSLLNLFHTRTVPLLREEGNLQLSKRTLVTQNLKYI